jgi:N-acetylglutamate synthase/N-acetylornithine aminotransferase
MADLRQDVHEMSDMLRLGNSEAINANIDKLNTNADYQNALKYMADDLKSITYPDSSVPIISQNFTLGGGEWKINAIPKGSYMPHKVINTLIAYEQSRFALAA